MVYARIIFFVFAAQAIAGKLEQIGMLKDRKRKSAQMLECWQEGQKNDECKKEYVVMRNAVQALSNMSCIKKEEDAITINTGTLMLGVAANQFIKNKTEQVTR